MALTRSPFASHLSSYVLALATLLAGVLAGCGDDSPPPPAAARANIQAEFPQGASTAEVTRVHVELRESGAATSIGLELSREDTTWKGSVDTLVPGKNYVLEGTAFNAASELLFRGEAGPISASAGGTVSVVLPLQPRTPPSPNKAPVIDTVSLSAEQVSGGGTVTAGLTAHDPEASTLTFSWVANQGVLQAPRNTASSSEVDWTAPPCIDGEVTLTAAVTDAAGAVTQRHFSIRARPGAACGDTTVHGVRNIHHVSSNGSIQEVPWPATATLGAWVPNADGIGYTWHAATSSTDGTFQIPGVASGPYLLQDNTAYMWTSSRTPDLSRATLGRPGVPSEPEGTQLTFQLSGLSPWQTGEDLQLHSPETGLSYFSLSCTNPYVSGPAVGETVFNSTVNYTVSFRNCGSHPIRFDPAAGDTLYATQFVSRLDEGGTQSFLELRRGVQVAAPTAKNGTLLLSATLAPLPTTSHSVSYGTASFEALALAAHPTATLDANRIFLGTLPAYTRFGAYVGWPDLVQATWPLNRGTFQAALTFGNPYPATWDRFITALTSSRISYSVDLPDGGTATPLLHLVATYAQEPLSASGTSTLTAQVGPPRDVRLNQTVATTPLTGVGLAPLASWTAPALGTPHYYSLRLYELSANAAKKTRRQLVASFLTDQTQIRLPPGPLMQDKSYYLEVTAIFSPGTSTGKPFLLAPVFHSASAVTSRFQP
ncbi:hypothetical protein SAMN05444354_10647 [Stigmatella aurantiaca]|uniref:Uncharacterized protein n=1 Tax=Stigmatella aurantiaca TaxID=41 RepID=A0A1H7Q8L3_STIAU|nr:hypothetical protein [Stigmatella aurantiaca]SEL44139.1 hypothetical protein SAMN05444354_10647 [Stigmatella aurantiaca]